jgi:hypothetical protein
MSSRAGMGYDQCDFRHSGSKVLIRSYPAFDGRTRIQSYFELQFCFTMKHHNHICDRPVSSNPDSDSDSDPDPDAISCFVTPSGKG